MKPTITALLLFLVGTFAFARQYAVNGSVRSATDQSPLAGVNIVIKGSTLGTTTNAEGNFSIIVNSRDRLVFSFIGYQQYEIVVNEQSSINITMQEDIATLGEVTIVSTGYQVLSKERANGSFVQLDKELINRRVSTDLLSRLEDVTSGLAFNRNVATRKTDISIRGTSTINSNAQPLIVIDNFPYDGDLTTINPNDVESITVLKDAAAASIWGARAANGVIVITTKKGKSNQPLKVSFNSNVTFMNKPDLFTVPRMSSEEFIAVERSLFANGAYTNTENSILNLPLTPAVELMIANRKGQLSSAAMESQLSALAQQDIRNDYTSYLYRTGVNQQYALNLNGGDATNRYYVSAGWDSNKDNIIGNGYDRVTLNFNDSWLTLKERLSINTAFYYSEHTTRANGTDPLAIYYNTSNPMYPYAALKDDSGNTLPVTKDYRATFLQQAQQKGVLNWQYNPIDEISQRNNTTKLRDYRINTSLNYKIIEGLHAEVLYQYWRGSTDRRDLRKEDSYFTRDLINRFTSISNTGVITNNIPKGSILDTYNAGSDSHSFRSQLNYTRSTAQHAISALAGYEVKELNTLSNSNRLYGYNNELATTKRVNYTTSFDQLNFPGNFTLIPFNTSESSLTDRFISYYTNATYSFKNKYSVSASARRDQSNLFGVKGNQRSVPLWSAGLGWIISGENFYKFDLLPFIKLRTTYGYNGNINKNISAYTTAYNAGTDFNTGLNYSLITNPPNPELRWERVRMWNLAVDFESTNHRITGSIEYYNKKATDLIGTSPYAPSAGILTYTSNSASTQGHGIDLSLNSLNIDGAFKWNTSLLLSTIREKVTTYRTIANATTLLFYGSGGSGIVAPREGKPLYSLYAYPTAGLNPVNGNPQFYFEGNTTSDYATLISRSTPESLIYYGSARPTTFGALRNTFSYKNISLSVNISYRLGYYFRKTSVDYDKLLSGYVQHGDYSKRWQQPGDEANTFVPSMPSAVNYNRTTTYTYSEPLVEKGDNIRLQDVNLSYTLDRSVLPKLPFPRIQIYSYVNNIGILWKAASGPIDPDFPQLKPSRTVALGLRLDL